MKLQTLTLPLFLIAFFATASIAPAAKKGVTACYQLQFGDSPIADEANQSVTQIWCYREILNPSGATFIFKADKSGDVLPELSMLVDRSGSIVHASRLAGELTVHRLESTWSPLPAPLKAPLHAKKVKQPLSISALDSIEQTIELFLKHTAGPQSLINVTEGEYSVAVKPELLPWRGYWYPHSGGRLHKGLNSPMAKFDRFVTKRTGKNPGAQDWESKRHIYTGVNWAGHCNGWAATSIMRKEPKESWTDPLSEETFEVSDLKAILIERDYCPEYLFFGHRYRGEGHDITDITAIDFHNTLTYYLGELGKPILMDIRRDIPVENRVVSGYTMVIERKGESQFNATAELTIHDYDSSITNEIGVAPVKPRTYKYRIWTDDSGNVAKAQWINQNPDFIWVPLAPSTCNSQNPAITEKWVQTLGQPIPLPEW